MENVYSIPLYTRILAVSSVAAMLAMAPAFEMKHELRSAFAHANVLPSPSHIDGVSS